MSPRPRTSRKQLGERARVDRSTSARLGARLGSARLVLVLVIVGATCWSQTAEAGKPREHAPGSNFALPFAPELAPLMAAPPSGGPGATIPVKPTPAQPDPSVDEDEDEDEDAELLEQPTQTLPTMQLERPTLQRKVSVPPFWLGREYDTHTTTALTFPPLYVHRQPKPGHENKLFHFDLSFTVAYYAKGRNKQRWMNPLVLFFYGKSEHKTVWASLPLLMGYRRVGDQFNFGQFPLVWWWGNRHVKNLFVFPVHYRKKAPDQVFGVSGFLAWYGNRNLDDENPDNDRRHFVFAPIYWRFQVGLRTIDASPIYFGGKNLATGLTHRTLLPFFHWQSREFGNRKELWTIPWVRRTDVARGRDAWALPLLLTFRDRNPQRELMAITPLVWSHRDRLRDRRTWVALLGGAVQDPNQDISWVAPIWWRFHDRRSDSSVNIVAPLALWRSTPERFAFHSLLASGWRNRSEGGESGEARGGGGGSLPLLTFVGHSPLRSRQFVLGGVFWRFANNDPNGTGAVDPDARRSAWGVGPLVYRSKLARPGGQDRARFGIPPLLTFVGRDGSKSHQVVTPLFWHVRNRDPEHQHDTWVLAPLYFQKRATGFRTGLPPLFVAANDERFRYAVAPLLLFGHVTDKQAGTSRTIWPLFVHAKTPSARVIGAGVIAWDIKREMTLAGGETQAWRDSVLFPLYYRRARGDARLHLSPLGGAFQNERGKTWLATLAYGFSREAGSGPDQFARRGGGFLPLVHHETRRDAEGKLVGATSVVFPLFGRDRRPERDLDVWTPLIWRASVRGDKPRNNLAIVPLYFGQRQPGGIDVDAGLLWFWSRDRTRHTHTVVAGPFYHRLTRDKLITGLGPLSYWEDSSKRRLLVVPPLVVSFEDKIKRQRTTVALPLWFDRTQQNDARRVWMAFPFVFGTHRKHDFTKAGIAFPLFYDIHRLRKNFRFTGVVPLLFRYQKGGFRADDEADARYTLWGSFPLFFYGHAKDRRTHSALALYWWDKNPEGWKFFTLLGGVGQQPGKSLTWYAPLIYRKVTNEQHTTFVWPLFAYHKGYRKDEHGKPYKDISTTWVLPPLYVGRHNEDRGWWQSSLLVWQFRRPHKVSTAVLPPVFFIQDSFKQRRLHWLLPLYVRDNHMAKGEAWTAVIPGLYVAHRNQKHDHAVQFPLVWHFANPKRRVTVGVPLWYDVRLHERGTSTQVVPGLYARRETETKVGHMIGPGLATWRREVEGQSPALHWRALFWLIGGGNEDGQRYMWLFGGKIKLKSKPLAPRKHRKVRKRRDQPEVEDQAARNEAIEADYMQL